MTTRSLADVPALLAELEQRSKRIAELETAQALVVEYRVPTPDGQCLTVRRESGGDRWAIATQRGGQAVWWVDGRWQNPPAIARAELWTFESAEAALSKANRLAREATP